MMGGNFEITYLHSNIDECNIQKYVYYKTYRIHGLFGSDFDLAVWRFFSCPPNLNIVL